VTPEDIVAQAITAGLHAIAITDHNTSEWIDSVKSAAASTGLTVFPGVEITVQPGVHVVAIFPEDRSSGHITDLLAALGIGTDERGNPEALVTKFGIQAVVSMIRECGALPVLAHIDAPRGAWQELRDQGQTLIHLWQAAEFAAVEIVGESLPDGVGCGPFDYCPACYWASDNPHPDDPTKHSHRGIGSRCSRFKLSEPITWEGLRLCFHDPDVRIRPGPPASDQAISHPIIEAVQVEGGFLAGLSLELNPNLNCVIGGRGTGKSTLLELIRHTFGVEPKTEANVRQAQGILKNTFLPGSRVTVHFRLDDGTAYRVERTADHDPQVFRAGSDEPLEVTPADLLPLQVYGQKEVYEISQDPAFQLRLLDNYVAEELRPSRREEEELLRRLRDNAAAILHKEEDIASAGDRLDELGAIEEELRRLEQQDFAARVEQKRLYEQESHLLDQAQAQVNGLMAALDTFLQEHRLDTDALADEPTEGLPNQDLLRAQGNLLKAMDTDMEQSLTTLKGRLEARWAEGRAGREAWQAAYAAQDEAYQGLLREFQASGEALNPDRYIQLQKRKLELEELSHDVQRQRAEVNRLRQDRREILTQLRSVRRHQYEIRRDKAAEITHLLKGDVRVAVHPQGYRSAYKDYLGALFAGLNVRNPHRDRLAEVEDDVPEREAQRPIEVGGETHYLVPRIPRYLDPIDLTDAIRIEQTRTDEEESLLENRFGVDSDAMRRNIAGVTQEKLFELEVFAVPDLPIIELHVAGGELGYRPLSALSVGQKCTALLSLVLLESAATLLIDQPEDDLDNQFIFDQIVATLRREKERRQFLIATHNANVPVSGDAELIIVLQANERRGWVDTGCSGSIDAEPIKQYVEQILEGGETAFRIRKEKYGIR